MISPQPAPGAALWLAAYAALTAAGGLPLFFVYERWGLLGFAVPAAALMALNLRSNLNRRTFSFSNEVLGILGLCLGAPAACFAARGSLAGGAWPAWGLSALYFLGPIFDIKAAALRHRVSADKSAHAAWSRMKTASLAYAAAALVIVGAAAAAGWLSAAAPLPFLAALHKTWRRGRLAPGRVDFRRLGFAEVVYSVFFVLVIGGGFLARAR
ncbi:MAG: hypothetical protein A2V88_04195 [Elusimicrobia bacterium RBG_16_66_12]|nr:MAG: hypothetical protein A2V88_04195 [Elusimicrobia bacterium RBG_16_66_12]